MSEILTDLAVTNLLITESLYANNRRIIDPNGNVSFSYPSHSIGGNVDHIHANSIVLNATSSNISTNVDNSILLNSVNGVMFSLPNSNSILFENIPNGFACWCWNDNHIIIKTKQNNNNYEYTVV